MYPPSDTELLEQVWDENVDPVTNTVFNISSPATGLSVPGGGWAGSRSQRAWSRRERRRATLPTTRRLARSMSVVS